jgi:hypothetical protein
MTAAATTAGRTRRRHGSSAVPPTKESCWGFIVLAVARYFGSGSLTPQFRRQHLRRGFILLIPIAAKKRPIIEPGGLRAQLALYRPAPP